MPKNIKIEEIDVEDIAKVSLSDAERLKKYQLAEGDIVYSRRGDVEKCALVTKNEANWLCGTGCLRIRIPRNKSITPYFLHAFLSTPVTREWVSRHAIGATMPNLNTSILRDVPIVVPPFDSMNFIGAMWIKLNRKIILNRKINQTLEQMSQSLFKSWFVDFDPVIDNALDAGNSIPEVLQSRVELRQKVRNSADFKPLPPNIRALFPAKFEETALGWAPKGWDIVKTEDIAIKIGMGPFGSNIKASQFVRSGIPIINGQQLKGFILEDNFINYITDEHANIIKNSLVYEHDIVLTHRGTLGQVSLIPKIKENEKFVISQSQFYLRVDRKKCSPFYMIHFLKSRIGQEALLSNASQVGVPSIARPSTHLKKITFINPPLSLHKLFDNEFEVILQKFMNCKEQSLRLIALRDTLLPKLISGELSLEGLPDLIKQTEAA
ncbi:TPA: restriction endonuclease subunit S [Enterobacter bugandensis]|nr:restriction endonuclease subunit S [Enterobacter bugandensis]